MHHQRSSVSAHLSQCTEGFMPKALPVVSKVMVPDAGQPQRFAMLAVGCKAGIVWLWRYTVPHHYIPSGSPSPEAFSLVCIYHACSFPQPPPPLPPMLLNLILLKELCIATCAACPSPPSTPLAAPRHTSKPSHHQAGAKT